MKKILLILLIVGAIYKLYFYFSRKEYIPRALRTEASPVLNPEDPLSVSQPDKDRPAPLFFKIWWPGVCVQTSQDKFYFKGIGYYSAPGVRDDSRFLLPDNLRPLEVLKHPVSGQAQGQSGHDKLLKPRPEGFGVPQNQSYPHALNGGQESSKKVVDNPWPKGLNSSTK